MAARHVQPLTTTRWSYPCKPDWSSTPTRRRRARPTRGGGDADRHRRPSMADRGSATPASRWCSEPASSQADAQRSRSPSSTQRMPSSSSTRASSPASSTGRACRRRQLSAAKERYEPDGKWIEQQTNGMNFLLPIDDAGPTGTLEARLRDLVRHRPPSNHRRHPPGPLNGVDDHRPAGLPRRVPGRPMRVVRRA